MSLIDRYIARQYLINVAVLLVILFCFVVAIDVALNLDRFVRVAEELARQDTDDPSRVRVGLIAGFLIADLWWPRLL